MAFVERFTDRVADYSAARPTYPPAALDFLAEHGLSPGSVVADVGSGTGILTDLLLERGAEVHAIEPNGPMRSEAERRLSGRPGFHSHDAKAEATTLADQSVDLITAAQAFHWFDVTSTRVEWRRILKPAGWVALLWNERQDDDGFSAGYGRLARSFVDEQGTALPRLADPASMLDTFFGAANYSLHKYANAQELDFEGVRARALSSSYWPREGLAHDRSMDELARLFARHQSQGRIRIPYLTELFIGRLC